MPVVKIDMWPGRSAEQKEAIIQGITEVFEKQGVPKIATTVVITEIPKENWGSSGEPHSKKFKDVE